MMFPVLPLLSELLRGFTASGAGAGGRLGMPGRKPRRPRPQGCGSSAEGRSLHHDETGAVSPDSDPSKERSLSCLLCCIRTADAVETFPSERGASSGLLDMLRMERGVQTWYHVFKPRKFLAEPRSLEE